MNSTLSLHSVVVATKHQVSCALGDELAILNMKSSVYYGVDPVGARIWSLLQQPQRVQELCDALEDEYDVERERCERDLLDLLGQMQSEGLIEISNA